MTHTTDRRARGPRRCGRRWAPLAAALALAAGVLACGSASRPGEGTARLAVSAAPPGASVASVVVTVTAGDGAFAPITAPLAGAGAGWETFVTGIPAGPARRFEVLAYDAYGAPRFQGAAASDVAAGAVTDVLVVLTDAPVPFQDAAPVIDALWSSQTGVAPGGAVQLGVLVHDPDPGDAVTVRWAATCGAIDAPALTTIRWTAPPGAGPCDVSVTAIDTHGASVSAFVTLDVS